MPKCPTCGKPVEWQDNAWRPFCSERCKLIDFDKWTSEEYRVPGRPVSTTETSQPPTVSDSGEAEEENEESRRHAK